MDRYVVRRQSVSRSKSTARAARGTKRAGGQRLPELPSADRPLVLGESGENAGATKSKRVQAFRDVDGVGATADRTADATRRTTRAETRRTDHRLRTPALDAHLIDADGTAPLSVQRSHDDLDVWTEVDSQAVVWCQSVRKARDARRHRRSCLSDVAVAVDEPPTVLVPRNPPDATTTPVASAGTAKEPDGSPEFVTPGTRVLDAWRLASTYRHAHPIGALSDRSSPSTPGSSAQRRRVRDRASRAVTELHCLASPPVNAPDSSCRAGAAAAAVHGPLTSPASSHRSSRRVSDIADEDFLSLFTALESAATEAGAECPQSGIAVHPWSYSSSGPRTASSERLLVQRVQAVNDDADAKGDSIREQRLYVVPAEAPPTAIEPSLVVVLRDAWLEADVRPHDVVRVIVCDADGHFHPFPTSHAAAAAATITTPDVVPEFVVDAHHNLLIVLPDVLVSGTAVANSFSCQRRVVLGERNRYSISNPRTSSAALRGTLLHELFQTALQRQMRGASDAMPSALLDERDVERGIAAHMVELYAVGEEEAPLRHFLQRCLHTVDQLVLQAVRDARGLPAQSRGTSAYAQYAHARIEGVSDVEESVWSPVFGLKGSLDVTAALRLRSSRDDENAEATALDSLTASTACVELKTGRSDGASGVAHRAQVIVYSLLLSDRYDVSARIGMLLYLQAQRSASAGAADATAEGDNAPALVAHALLIPTLRAELIGLLSSRNRLARYLAADDAVPARPTATAASAVDGAVLPWMQLPPQLQRQPRVCGNCYVRHTCALMHRVVEQGTAEGSVLPAEFARLTHSLSEAHIQYYRRWLTLTRLEELATQTYRQELWTMTPQARERLGRCMASLQVERVQNVGCQGIGRYYTVYRHWFRRACSPATPVSVGDVSGAAAASSSSRMLEAATLTAVLAPGEYVSATPYVLDDTGASTALPPQKTAIAFGFVHAIESESDTALVVDLDRDCSAWLQQRLPDTHDPKASAATAAQAAVQWRIDREELSSGFSTQYGNLEALLYPEAERLRQLVVDCAPPHFDTDAEDEMVLSGCRWSDPTHRIDLNAEQRQAVRRLLAARDYALMLGMPGTGKTATIACTIVALVQNGYTVLLASHTHSAVDNVLLRLLQQLQFHDFVRVGHSAANIAPPLHPYTVAAVADGANGRGASLEAFSHRLDRVPLVAVTCMGISSPVFYRRTAFDFVIVDEASQISQPVSLGPIRLARRAFVLVGDPMQLPPLARSAQGRASGASESLFRRLCDAHPEAVCPLRQQYRMARPIMQLCNALVYDGALVCGNERVAVQQLRYREENTEAGRRRAEPSWLTRALCPTRSVVWVDTAAVSAAAECRTGPEQLCNGFEAETVARMVQALLARGVAVDEIGVTAPLRAQVLLLRATLGRHLHAADALPELPECRTIDQFQGRDKDVMLVSLVRHNTAAHIGEVLRDWRRINVAITRARKKLILIGSSTTLRTSPFLARLIEWVHNEQGVIDLSEQDHYE